MHTKTLSVPGFEKVVEATLASGIKSIVAIHSTKLGPALGGVRFYSYSNHREALEDVCRLAEAMTYKAALADLPLGGGKAVIIGDPHQVKTIPLLEDFGCFVDSLGGSYLTAKDVGVTVKDLAIIARKTTHVTGTELKGSSGDPSPITAFGVYQGMLGAAQFVWGDASLRGKQIIVQGLGGVGWETAHYLVKEDAEVLAIEIDSGLLQAAKNELGIQPLPADSWELTEADIFCPCALGAVVHEKNIPKLAQNGIRIIAGGANNQLEDEERDGQLLHETGILYAPDYVINAGGLINIACEIEGYNADKARKMTQKIRTVLLKIFGRSQKENRSTALIAHELALEKMGK